MKCRRCGTELRSDDEFCYRCGERTTVLQRMVSSRMFVGSLIAVIVVIIAGVAAYLVLTDRVKLPDFSKNPITSVSDAGDNGDGGANAGGGTADTTAAPEATDAAAAASAEPAVTPEPVVTPAVFQPGDVTDEEKSAMKPLLERVKPFLAFSASFYADGSHAYKWDNVSATTLALYKLQYVDKKVKYGDSFASIKKKVQKEMNALYGKNCKFKLTYSGFFPDYVYVKSGNTVVYNAVGINGKTYRMNCKKIIQYKEGKYRVIVDAYLYNKPIKQKGDSQKYTLFVSNADDNTYGYEISKIRLYKKADSKVPKK